MSRAAFQRAAEVFLRVRELEGTRRGEELEALCAGDGALRAEVESLLAEDGASPADGRVGGLSAIAAIEALRAGGDAGAGAAGAGPPTEIGRYRIVGTIGEGGMGVVYEAEQQSPRRTVALKVIRPGLATPSMLRRFEHEAEALGRLQHPGIAQVYEAGRADAGQGGAPYFAMELIRGMPLLRFAESAGLDLRARLDLVARVADAIQHAHSKGVIHRDLKPGNILVSCEGPGAQPKVLDFGIARFLDEQAQAATLQTGVGQLMGTVPYMSPEQAGGEPAAVDTRTDIYSLGVILYELLTGQLPCPVGGASITEALRIIREVEPARPASIDRHLRGDAETIVLHALEKEPGRRYQSAAELASDIRRFLRDEPVHARPATAMYQLRKFARRNKALVGGAAIAALAMLVATVVSVRQAAIAVAARRVADDKTLAAERQALRATLAAATVAADRADPLSARRLLDSVPEPERRWEWRHLSSRIDQSALLVGCDDDIRAAVPSPAGDEIVTLSGTGLVQRWRAADGGITGSITLETPITGPASISDDATRVAAVFGDQGESLGLFDALTGRRLADLPVPPKSVRILAISSDGRRIAAGGPAAFLWVPLDSGAVTTIAAPTTTSLSFSRDGRWLGAGFLGFGHFDVYDATTGERVLPRKTYPGQNTVVSANLGDDGSIMAVGTIDKHAYIHDMKANRNLRDFPGHTAPVRAVSIERGQKRLASAADDGTVRVWGLQTDESPFGLTGHAGPINSVAFIPDGWGVMAVSGRSLRVWSLPPDDRFEVLRDHTSYVYAVVFVPGRLDRQRMISGAWDGTLRIWDAGTRECLAVIRVPGSKVYALSVSERSGTSAGSASEVSPPLLAVATDGAVFLYSAITGQPFGPLQLDQARGSTAVALSVDGRRLVARSEGALLLLDPDTGAAVAAWSCRSSTPYNAVAISPDGRFIACDGERGETVVWDTESQRELLRLPGHESAVCALAFSPDGSLLASGSADRTIRLWTVGASGGGGGHGWRGIRRLTGHSDTVYDLAFSPDGSRLASGSNDTTVRLWDVSSGEEVALLAGHADYIFSLAFSPDGEMLVSGSGDHTVRIWDTQPVHARRRERAVMQRLREEVRPGVAQLLSDLGDPDRVANRLRSDSSLDGPRLEASLQVLLQLSTQSFPSSDRSQ